MTASHAATSTRLSSTLRSTSCALRTMTVSFPSAITVLSPVVAVLGTAAAPLVSAALGAGDGAPAWRDVSAKVTVPILESEHAASTISGASAISFAVFILPPHRGGQGEAMFGREVGKRCAVRDARSHRATPHQV